MLFVQGRNCIEWAENFMCKNFAFVLLCKKTDFLWTTFRIDTLFAQAPLTVACATFFVELCTNIIRQPIELESCSTIYGFSKCSSSDLKKFFRFEWEVLCGWRHNGGMFLAEVTRPWTPNHRAIFCSRFFSNLEHHPSL